MANKNNSLSSTTWMCKYHIVFIPKYRRKSIYGQYRESLQEIIRTLCKYKGVEILEGHMMPDHVHLLLSIPPKISVSSFMGYLKGKSALMMFDKHANLKYKFGNRHFWAEGYYVSTVGLNEATIRKYISDQDFFTVDMVTHGKPAPDIFLLAAKTKKYHPSDCIVIGDSVNDFMAAKSANMDCIAFVGATGNNTDEYINKCKTYDIFDICDNMDSVNTAINRWLKNKI